MTLIPVSLPVSLPEVVPSRCEGDHFFENHCNACDAAQPDGPCEVCPIGIRFPVHMRAAPTTLTFYNPSAANAFVRNTTAGSNATATASANVAASGMDATFTGIAAWTVAQSVALHYTADAEL